jgi:hypothetical protein
MGIKKLIHFLKLLFLKLKLFSQSLVLPPLRPG